MMSDSITSGVLDPEMKSSVSCCNASVVLLESSRYFTFMPGLAFSNPAIAVLVALSSAPKPCVAYTMVTALLDADAIVGVIARQPAIRALDAAADMTSFLWYHGELLRSIFMGVVFLSLVGLAPDEGAWGKVA